jgi:N-acyl-L-homoserine lactone synthetase
LLCLIGPHNYESHVQDINETYKLRYDYFYKNLKWNVKTHDGLEKDEYDTSNAYYFIYKDQEGSLKGCLRLIEMTKECMFDDPFNFLLPNLESFKKSGYWEISRLAIDPNSNETEFKEIFTNLIVALSHFGLKNNTPKTYLALSHPTSVELAKSLGILVKLINEDSIENRSVIVSAYTPDFESHEKLMQKLLTPLELEIPTEL